MDSRIWLKDSFTLEKLPAWACPSCNRGRLILKKDEFIFRETLESRKMQEGPHNWDTEFISFVFTGMLVCRESDCQEVVAFSGVGNPEFYHDVDDYGRENGGYEETFSVRFFEPALHLFPVNQNCPKDVREAIILAFRLYWSDQSSCANKIRVALELIMDQQKVKKTVITKKRERRRLTLGERIDELAKKMPEIENHLDAIRWIGNSGSHNDGVTKEDLLDAFRLLEYSIEKLYDNKPKLLAKLSREIVKKKGPRSKQRRGPL